MKNSHALRNFLFGSTLLAAVTTTANATIYYWDSDDVTAGFGDTNGTWGTSNFWSTDSTGSTAGANPTLTTADTINFGTASLAYGTAGKTITLTNSTKSVGAIVFGSAQTPSIKLSTTAIANGNISLVGNGGIITVDGGTHIIEGTGTSSSGGSRDLAFGTIGTTLVTFSINGTSSLEIKGRIGGGNNTTGATYTKNGTGTLILSGHSGSGSSWQWSNSTTGGFKVMNGVLRFTNAGASGNTGNIFTVSSGAAIEIDGGIVQNLSTGKIALSGTGIITSGALRSLTGNNSSSASIVLSGSSSIGVDADTLTLTGIISNATARNLTKVGAGTLTLTGTNTYSGTTTISSGTLQVGNGSTTGSIAGTSSVTNNAALIYNRSDDLSASYVIGGTGTLEKKGAGVLTLTNTNTYSGITTVTAGTLAVSTTGAIANSTAINVAAGAKFVYNSTTPLTVAPTLNGAGSNKATFSGSGTINASIALDSVDDVISPGNSPGFQNYGVNQTWSSFSYDWELNDWNNAVAATNIDQIQITGSLDLSAVSANQYLLNILSLDSTNASGLVGAGVGNTFTEANRSWNILTTTTGITGFNASEWQIVPGGFQDLETGTWAISQSGNNLVLTYTAVPEPGAALIGGLGLLVLLRRRRA